MCHFTFFKAIFALMAHTYQQPAVLLLASAFQLTFLTNYLVRALKNIVHYCADILKQLFNFLAHQLGQESFPCYITEHF